MIWKKVTIYTTVEVEDLISEFLDEQGVEGVQIEDNVPLTEDEIREMFVDIPLIPDENDGTAKVSFFLDDSYDDDKINSLIADIKAELGRLEEFLPVGCKKVEVEDTSDDTTWNDRFKEFFTPTRLYDDIVILPSWFDENVEFSDSHKINAILEGKDPSFFRINDDDKIIRIETVTAFGTGTHETTRLCIGEIKKYMKEGASVFDVGCGSGILSIAACLMGAGYVHGLDIDPQAVNASKVNAAASGLTSDRIDFTCGNLLSGNKIAEAYMDKEDNRTKVQKASLGSGIASAVNVPDDETLADKAARIVDLELGAQDEIPARKYDIVVANILADVIIPLSAMIHEYLTEDGVFITSGISDTRADEVKAALKENNFEIISEAHENEWIAISAKKIKE